MITLLIHIENCYICNNYHDTVSLNHTGSEISIKMNSLHCQREILIFKETAPRIQLTFTRAFGRLNGS